MRRSAGQFTHENHSNFFFFLIFFSVISGIWICFGFSLCETVPTKMKNHSSAQGVPDGKSPNQTLENPLEEDNLPCYEIPEAFVDDVPPKPPCSPTHPIFFDQDEDPTSNNNNSDTATTTATITDNPAPTLGEVVVKSPQQSDSSLPLLPQRYPIELRGFVREMEHLEFVNGVNEEIERQKRLVKVWGKFREHANYGFLFLFLLMCAALVFVRIVNLMTLKVYFVLLVGCVVAVLGFMGFLIHYHLRWHWIVGEVIEYANSSSGRFQSRYALFRCSCDLCL